MVTVNTNDYSSLKKLFSLTYDAVLGVADGIVVFSNSAADRLWGHKTEGKKVMDILPEYVCLDIDGSFICSATIGQKPVSVSVSQMGSIALICVSLLRSGAEPAIDYSKVMSSLNSHMHTLRTAADWLLDTVDLSDPRAGVTASIMMKSYFTVFRALNNVSTLQQLARGTLPFDPVWTDLSSFLKNLAGTVDLLVSKMGIRVEFKNPGQPCRASVDEKLLEQLILNLISNSLLSMSAGGTIKLSLSSEETKVIISVDDDGAGISEQILSELFNSPIRDSELSGIGSGSGLGLYIARGIVEIHGGVILVESRDKAGVSVGIMLPRGDVPKHRFSTPREKYISRGMDSILRELSVVLNYDYYGRQFSD